MPTQPPIAPIETPRLQLRELHDGDAPFLVALLNDPAFLQHIGDRNVRNAADACRYLADGPCASYRRHGHGLLRVALRDGDTPIGICGLLKRDTLDDADLGYALLPAFRGCGYVHEAAQAVLAHAQTALGLRRVAAVVAPGNVASGEVLRRLGFAFEGSVALHPNEALLQLFVRELAACLP